MNSLTALLETERIRISFQNRVLVYFLFCCGGFAPSPESPASLVREGTVRESDIIVRHGPDQERLIRSVLEDGAATDLLNLKGKVAQTDTPLWQGGYFGQHGTLKDQKSAPNEVKKTWRIEYLPSPTKLVASAFCATLAGYLMPTHGGNRLRITLHRAMTFGSEEVLQQCCHYYGANITDADQGEPGRTFPALNATIGAAYQSARIVRSVSQASAADLQRAMGEMRLIDASSEMAQDVNRVLAVPLLRSDNTDRPIAVLFVDSKDGPAFSDSQLRHIVQMLQNFGDGLESRNSHASGGVYNAAMFAGPKAIYYPLKLPVELEVVDSVDPPSVKMRQLNFEYSDFVPV